jgi:single-strand DNA-binding protein
MRVIVQGRLKQREWETKEGEKRTSYEIDVDEVGPSLKFATAKVVKTQRGGGGGFGGGQAADDPWASATPAAGAAAPAGNSGGWGATGSPAGDEPPF